jgi:hypothetical protein
MSHWPSIRMKWLVLAHLTHFDVSFMVAEILNVASVAEPPAAQKVGRGVGLPPGVGSR